MDQYYSDPSIFVYGKKDGKEMIFVMEPRTKEIEIVDISDPTNMSSTVVNSVWTWSL